ncbi:F-box protein-like [Dorcoceras hygrometricum]|nr:F-box protein-like [Dorcoceras hygrometricum]
MTDTGGVRARYDNATQIGYLDEILINIISRLPLKVAVACKTVAKNWLSMISEPKFAKLHLSHAQKSPNYIICPFPKGSDIITHLSLMEGDGKIYGTLPLPGFETISSPDMVCHLNGLICSVNEIDFDEVEIRIFNPITQELLLIPEGSPSLIPPSVGVIFDPNSTNYKVFRFFLDSIEAGTCKCEVYASDSTEWRLVSEDVERPDPNPICPMCPYYVSVAGKMYWFEWSEPDPSYPIRILSVDLNDEFSTIALPKAVNEWSFLIEVEGCLALVWIDYPDLYAADVVDDPKPFLEVWKLEALGWKLRASGVLEVDLLSIRAFNSVACRDNEIFFIIKIDEESPCFCIFDMGDGTLRTLDMGGTFDGCVPVAFPFAESLLKLEIDGETSASLRRRPPPPWVIARCKMFVVIARLLPDDEKKKCRAWVDHD